MISKKLIYVILCFKFLPIINFNSVKKIIFFFIYKNNNQNSKEKLLKI